MDRDRDMNGLYKHQLEFLADNPDKSTLVWSCGTGKTRTAIEWTKTITPYDTEIGETLVICPKALKANWEREKTKWQNELVTVVTKEEFRRDWKTLKYYRSVIVDEVHNGFLTPNFKSQMSKALRGYLKKHNTPRVLLLSATVYTSSPWNIYNLGYYTGHVWNYRDWQSQFFTQVKMGPRWIPVPKKGIEQELADIVRGMASVVDIHDVLDVPLQNHLEPEYFTLTKEQKKAIKDNYDPLPIVRYTQQHEIENGILLGNEFRNDQEFTIDKEERIKTLCEENDKVAIVCRYTGQLRKLERELSKSFNVSVISGEVSDRDRVCVEAEQAQKAVVLIQADCGVGFQLPSFGLCIYASMSYSYTSWEQMNGRFLRMDKPSRTTFVYLLTEGDSIDQAVYDAVKRKEDFRINLYETRGQLSD